MSDNPVYQSIIDFAHEVEDKANVEAVRSGEYDSEYPIMSEQARTLRKQLISKAEQALEMIKSGELEV